jgi:hypothetical protein
MEQEEPPLRAIILDNDETTGSYIIIYTILLGLSKCIDVTEQAIIIILRRLANWMIIHNVFRPGLRVLLRTLHELKNHNAIDAVIMYTNQTGYYRFTTLDDVDTYVSVPMCISYMMGYLCDRKIIFDNILMRDKTILRDKNGRHSKSFSRILDLYPTKPRDIRQMIFVDDQADPNFIRAHDISKDKQHEESWCAIEPYFRRLSYHELMDCFKTCFEDTFALQDHAIIEVMMSYYYKYAPIRSSAPNAKPFLNLCSQLIRRFPLPIESV